MVVENSITDSPQMPLSDSAVETDENQSRYRFLAESVPLIVWTAWPDGSRNYFNKRWYEVTGLTEEETLGWGWQAAVHPDDLARTLSTWRISVETGSPYEIEHRFRCASDGSYRWHLARAYPQRRKTGEIVQWVGTCTDIDDQKRAEEALRRRALELSRTSRALERTNRELDQFAYVASHDLKAPLRGIANLSLWIEEDLGDCLNEQSRQHLELLRGRVNRMEAMIEGILQYSRIGRVQTKREEVSVGTLLAEVIDLIASPAEVRIVIAPDMPTVTTDKLRLQQVFMNLIGNAIKHAQRPDVEIRIETKETDDFVEFAVSDNGPGIAPQYHEKIFQFFQTLEARDKVEGTGIGLSIVKKIIESQGGTVQVDSEEGRGATFRFTLPKTEDPE